MTDPMTYKELDDLNSELSEALKKAVDENERLRRRISRIRGILVIHIRECKRLVRDQRYAISEYNRLQDQPMTEDVKDADNARVRDRY